MVPIFNTQQIIPSSIGKPQLEYFICKGIFREFFIRFLCALCTSVVNYPVFVKMSIPTAREISLLSSVRLVCLLPCSVGTIVIALAVLLLNSVIVSRHCSAMFSVINIIATCEFWAVFLRTETVSAVVFTGSISTPML